MKLRFFILILVILPSLPNAGVFSGRISQALSNSDFIIFDDAKESLGFQLVNIKSISRKVECACDYYELTYINPDLNSTEVFLLEQDRSNIPSVVKISQVSESQKGDSP